MYSFSFESHPIIRILSLSKQIHIPDEAKSPFLAFSKKINDYRNHIQKNANTSDSKDEKRNASDPLKAIADVCLLLQSIKFRTFSDEDLHKIYEMILNGSTLTQIDSTYEFAFPFFSDSLTDITDQSIKNLVLFFQRRKKANESNSTETQKSKNTNDPDFTIDLNNKNVIESLSIFIFFIFYSSISWMANSERSKTSEGIFTILRKLNLILFLFTNFINLNTATNNSLSETKERFFINFTQVRKLAIDTFLFILYYAAAQFPEFTFSDEVFDLLNDFFTKSIYKNKNLTKVRSNSSKQSKSSKKNTDTDTENDTFLNSVHILLYFLSIELNKSSEKVPPLCNFISQVIENQSQNDLLTDELYLHIFHILAGKLSELDETILQFFVRISAQFEKKDDKVLIHFPTFLTNFLRNHTENPIKIVRSVDEKCEDDCIFVHEIENVPIINYRATVQNFQFNFFDKPTFENGLTLTQNTEIPQALRLYLPNEVVTRIDLVSELFQGTLFTEQFMKILAGIDKESNFHDFLYYLAVFLSVCEDQTEIAPHFIMTIFNSPLFEGKYEDFSQNERKKFISSLIYSSVSLLIHSYSLSTLMEPVINTKLYLPTVLTAIFQDLNIMVNYSPHLYHQKSDPKDDHLFEYFRSQPFIMIFYNASLFYQTANINDRTNVEIIEKCRVSLLLFMESFIKEWSDSHHFDKMFLSYLFEPSLQQFVLSHFNLLWESDNFDSDLFISIFDSCLLLFSDTEKDETKRNKAISLMYEVLKVVNSIILRSNNSKIKTSKPRGLISLHKPLTNILLKLRKDEIEFICEIIEYFSIASDSNCIDPITIQTFSDTIQKIGMTNEIRSKLIRLLAGNQAPSIVSHFSIEQPYALPLFVTLFISEKNSNQLNDNFKLLEQLVSYSNKNAIMCHKGNLDFILLDFIDNCESIIAKRERQIARQQSSLINNNLDISFEKTQFELYLSNYFKDSQIKEKFVRQFDDDDNNDNNLININLFRKDLMKKDTNELMKEIKNAMSLFIKISLVKSSILVVRKYISLLSTSLRTKALLVGKNEKISEIYNKIACFYFNNLFDLISFKFRMPTTFLPISEIRTPEIEISNISSSYFNEGFTATFWIYLIQQSVKSSSVLFTLSDSNENEISAKIIDTSYIIILIHNSKKITFTLNTVFPAGQWFLTSVTIARDKKKNIYSISASINSTPIFGDCQTDYFELIDPLTITINGKENNNNSLYLSNVKPTSHTKKTSVKRSASTITYNKNELFKEDDSNIRNRRSGSICFVPEVENNESDDCALLGPFGFFKPLHLINAIQMQQSGPRYIPHSTIEKNDETQQELKQSTVNSLRMIGINSTLAPSLLSFDSLNYNLNSNSSTNDSNSSVTKIIYIYFDKINGVFNAVNDESSLSKKHVIFLKGPKYHQTLSFDEVLVQYFKIQSLIPLFKYEEENADEIVSLFSMILSVGTYVQTNFHQCNGFSMISHILKEYDPKHLTYSLYSKFVNLNNQLTVQELKNDLIENIIVRFDLWCLSSSIETTQRIIKHWLSINSNFDTNFIGNFKTFDDVMFSLDLFKDVQLKQNMLKLLFKVEDEDQISLENTNKFIEFIMCQSEIYKADVSYLLEFLIDNCQYFAATNLFVNLATLLSNTTDSNKENENDINFIIIDLFNKLYKNKKIQKPRYFYQLINSLIDLIPIEIFEEEKNILKLIEYSKTIPECLSILFYGIAFSIKNNDDDLPGFSLLSESGSSSMFLSNDDYFTDNDSNKNLIDLKSENESSQNSDKKDQEHLINPKINIVIENLKASSNYCFSKKWFLWPIIAAFKVNDSFFTNFIMNFIVNSITEEQNNNKTQNLKNEKHEKEKEEQNNNQDQNSQQNISSKYDWLNVFVLINLVGESISYFLLNKNSVAKMNRLKEIDTFNISKVFLNVLFLKEKEKDELIEFLNLCHFFIFFKPLWFENRALQLLYNKSLYHRSSSSSSRRSSNLKSNNKMNRLNDCTKLDIFNQLKENFKKERNYKFSLRFDDAGNWIDRDFAIQTFEETSQLPEFSKFNKMTKFLINKQILENQPDSNGNNSTPKNFNSYTHSFTNIVPFMSLINNLFLSIGKSVTKEFPIPENPDLITTIKSERSLFNRNIKMFDEFCQCCWSQLWITLNAEMMPWRLKIEPTTNNDDENDVEDEEFIKQLHYQYPHLKLDFTPCYALCPMKLKKDFHYVKHKSLREIQIAELRKLYMKKLKKNDENSIETKKFMKKIIEKINKTQVPARKKRRSSSFKEYQTQQQQQQQQQQPDIFSFFSYLTETVSGSVSPSNSEVNNEPTKNRPIIKIKCELITIKRKMRGHCYFYNDKVELSLNKPIKEIINNNDKNNDSNQDEKKTKKTKYIKKIIDIYYDEIRLILSRMILHHPSGIEIFTYLQNSYLLNFPRLNSTEILTKFSSICPNKNICILSFPSSQTNDSLFPQISFSFQGQTQLFNSGAQTITAHAVEGENSASIYSSLSTYLTSLTNWWRNGIISNFSYLIELNMLSGRSFNDPSMYPVFPWIVRDYECKEIRWKDKDFYRDLSLPVGALNKERLEELVQRRKEMVQFNADYIFLYGAGYSTPLSLFNWMIRLEPFASLHVEMQNGHFDHPHRMFYSIKSAYKLSTSNSNDYRELIPEFFFLPGFLENKNKFNFGCLEDSFNTLTEDDINSLNKDEISKITMNNDEIQENETEQNNNNNNNNDVNETETKQNNNNNDVNETETKQNNNNNNNDENKSDDDDKNQESESEQNKSDDSEEEETKTKQKKNKDIEIDENKSDEEEDKETKNEPNENKDNENEQKKNNNETENKNTEPRKLHRINDVELPNWATSPIDFIYKHRKILESKHVSRHINEWIDLIFGVEQRNQDTNQFHPWMYPNVWERRQQQIRRIKRDRQQKNVVISTSSSYNISSVSFLSSSSSNSSISLTATNSDRTLDTKSFLEPPNDSLSSPPNTNGIGNVAASSSSAEKDQETINNNDDDEIGIPTVSEIEEFLAECGQIPQQLFSEKHPVKQKLKKQSLIKEDLFVEISSLKKNGVLTTLSSNNDALTNFFLGSSSNSQNQKDKIELNVDFAAFVRIGKSGSSNGIESKEKLVFLYVTDEGSIVKATVSLYGIECEGLSSEKMEKILRNENDQFEQKKLKYFRGYLASSSDTGNVRVFNLNGSGSMTELKGHIGKLNCLSSDQVLLVSSGSDTLTNIYDHKLRLLFSIPSFRGEIVSSYVNSIFSIIATITMDSSLFLISTSTGTITKVISLQNRQPLSVIVTNAWGFIIVFAEENIYNKQTEKWQICHFFLLYSINGEKICEKKVDFISSISTWTSFTSNDGFDFLAVCDDKGDLFVFEVYPFLSSTNLRNEQKNKEKIDINDDLIDFGSADSESSSLEPIFRSNMDVVTLFYWSEYRVIVGIVSNGHAFFVPLDYH